MITCMTDEGPYDLDALRKRFSWVRIGTTDEADLSSRYREIMADSLRNRRIVDALEDTRLFAHRSCSGGYATLPRTTVGTLGWTK